MTSLLQMGRIFIPGQLVADKSINATEVVFVGYGTDAEISQYRYCRQSSIMDKRGQT